MINMADRFKDAVRQILRQYGLEFLMSNDAKAGEVLMYNGSEWVGQELEEWQPHEY